MERDVPDEVLPSVMELEKEFILEFESLPILWDKTHKLYCNKYKRNDALGKLLEIYIKIKPGATIEDVKKKINVLRSNYRRELKKIVSSRRSGCGRDEVYSPKNWTFEYLHFLDKFEQPVPLNGVSDGNNNEAESDQPQTEQEVAATISSFVSAPQPQPPARPSPLGSKKSVIKTQNELLERACNYLSEPQVSGAQSIAFDWAETLARLTPTQRLYAKKAINDVLFEAELGNLHRYSVQINVSSTPSPAPSPYRTHTQVSSPPESSYYLPTTSLDYFQTPVTAPPGQSPYYIQTQVTAPPAQSPKDTQTQDAVQIKVASTHLHEPSPYRTYTQVSSPPESSYCSPTTSLDYIETPVPAPIEQSPYYIQTQVTAPPVPSPKDTQTQDAVQIKVASTHLHAPSPYRTYIQVSSPPESCFYSPTTSLDYIKTQVTAPPAQSPKDTQTQDAVQIKVASTHLHEPSPYRTYTQVSSPPESSFYSPTTSLDYIKTPVTAPPAQSPKCIKTPVTAPPAQSPKCIKTSVTAPPAQSPKCIKTPVTAPNVHSSTYIQRQVRAPRAQSPNYIQTSVTAPVTHSSTYIPTQVRALPSQSPNYIQTSVTAPVTHSSTYIPTQVRALPSQSPNYIQTSVTAPVTHSSTYIPTQVRALPSQSPNYIQTSVTAPVTHSSTYIPTQVRALPSQSPNYIQTSVTAPLAHSSYYIQTQAIQPTSPSQPPSYTLHIPSPSSMSQDSSEYTAGSLFSQFQA